MLSLVLRGFLQRKLRVSLTGDRDRARRRADGRHLHPHGHDQPVVRGDLPDREQGPRRRRHARRRRSAARCARRPRRSTEAMLAQRARHAGRRAGRGRIFTSATLLDTHGKRLTRRRAGFVASTLPRALRELHAGPRRLPAADRSEVAIDEATAERARPRRSASRSIVAGARGGAALHDRRHRQVRRRRIVRRRRRRAADACRGAARRRRAGALRPDRRRRRRRASRPDDAARADPRRAARGPSTCAPAPSRPRSRPPTSEANLGFLRTFLLIFAYVALFVGAFIIFNTFSITVAQRTREFGLLRTLGGLAPADACARSSPKG